MSPSNATNPLAQLSTSLADAVETAGRSVVAIHARRRIPSSGVMWRDGIVVSASHTVRRDGEVAVGLPNGESVRATVIGRDYATDLVALTVNGASASIAQRAAEDSARIGSLVLAVGRPGRKTSASFGIVSAVVDDWRAGQGSRIGRVLRLDLSIYDGFSGGPLVDASGAVIGIDNSALARGVPVAITASTVDRVVDELLEHGHMRRPFIGVAVQQVTLNAATVARHNLSHDSGLVIVSLVEGSPADSAGILMGDILLASGDRPLRRPIDLLDALNAVGADRALEMQLLRAGAVMRLSISPIDYFAEREEEEDE